MITDGQLDLAVVGALKSQQTRGHYVCIREEEMLALIPRQLLSATAASENVFGADFRLSDYKEQPFALVGRDSTMREWQEQIFRAAGFTPQVAFETAKGSTILKMVSRGLCCSVMSDYYYDPTLADIACFHLPDRPKWEISALYNEAAYLTEPAKYFIQLCREMLSKRPKLVGME